MNKPNRYNQLIEAIFFSHFEKGKTEFVFHREEIEATAASLGIKLPKNLGDLIYSFRYRTTLPQKILDCAPKKKEWVILSVGKSQYKFEAVDIQRFKPNPMLSEIKIPDATPAIISMYALNDEQAILAKLRYNRLIDIFTHVTCYSLQNHLRTTVAHMGQVEIDELYVGVDRGGAHYVFPVQAKGGRDQLSVVQLKQDMATCAEKFSHLICRPIGAQFMQDNIIALFEFEENVDQIKICSEKHYRLVPPEELSSQDLEKYKATANQSM
jgi:hypothetical protein